MTYLDDKGRPEPPSAADEAATVIGFLEYQRATLAWKCAGLDAAGLRATVAASSMTLGGILKHLARVEHVWLVQRLAGPPNTEPRYNWDADWTSAADDSPDDLRTGWETAVAASRTQVNQALAAGGMGHLATGIIDERGESPSLRWILLHLVEEYARHNGHADLLRESVDGQTGE